MSTSPAAPAPSLSDLCPAALRRPVAAALRALDPAPARLAVAVSGGADSAMLAVAAGAALPPGCTLRLFHVHHGLQAAADQWAAQVRGLGALLGVPVDEARVTVPPGQGLGMEAAARLARYQALAGLARQHGVRHILLAHHRNDQAETVLLRLLRGTGLQGMAAMAPFSERDGVAYLRPWLDVDHAAILALAGAVRAQCGWQAVQDPTNTDPRYARAAVRTQLAPALDARWPGWQAIVARHARQMAEAAEIVAEVAQADFATLEPADAGRSFSLAAWRGLSAARQAQALRHWLASQDAPMPTEARLAELQRQLRQLHALGHDRHLRWQHAGRVVRCERGRVWIDD